MRLGTQTRLIAPFACLARLSSSTAALQGRGAAGRKSCFFSEGGRGGGRTRAGAGRDTQFMLFCASCRPSHNDDCDTQPMCATPGTSAPSRFHPCQATVMAPKALSHSRPHAPAQPLTRYHHCGEADTFALAVTRQAVAQAALAVGCKETYPSVLDALTDLVRDYIVAVGVEAQSKAEAGGRTRATLLDVLAALEVPQQENARDRYEMDWRALRGFAFQGDESQLDRPEAFQWYQPFHTHIPPFPVHSRIYVENCRRSRKRALPLDRSSDVDSPGRETDEREEVSGGRSAYPRPAFVPSFLPPFPPEHTFRKTAVKASTKLDDPVAIQRHRIATKQLVLKTIARQNIASVNPKGEKEGNCAKA